LDKSLQSNFRAGRGKDLHVFPGEKITNHVKVVRFVIHHQQLESGIGTQRSALFVSWICWEKDIIRFFEIVSTNCNQATFP
jgi:hypothetical protein